MIWQRNVDYLRVSITDRCNERCRYCMPQGFRQWKSRADILSYEEVLRVVEAAVSLGFSRFRVTGGEPLVREGAAEFVVRLIATPGVREVGLSTNGTLLAPVAEFLARGGLRSVNVSLDALDPDLYRRLTGGRLRDVLAGLDAARRAGIAPIKLNTVLLRGVNEGQIWPLIHYAGDHEHVLRFIELMPLSNTDRLTAASLLPLGEVMQAIGSRTEMVPDESRHGNGPAVYYRLPRHGVTVGFIGAMTNRHFCEACNKMRLTADGKIRPCLGHHLEFDLKPALRGMRGVTTLRETLRRALAEKPAKHLFRDHYQPGRIMTAIGG